VGFSVVGYGRWGGCADAVVFVILFS